MKLIHGTAIAIGLSSGRTGKVWRLASFLISDPHVVCERMNQHRDHSIPYISSAAAYSCDRCLRNHQICQCSRSETLGPAEDQLVPTFEDTSDALVLDVFRRDVIANVSHDRLSVHDQGPGIPAHHIPGLAERIYRVDSHRSREVGGMRLGLAIVKHIANRHRGHLVIESVLGKGSAFSIILPVLEK